MKERDVRLRRLRYRSWHRGCKETDVVLGRFADTRLHELDDAMLGLYEELLEENDTDIWNWLTERQPFDARYLELIELLKEPAV